MSVRNEELVSTIRATIDEVIDPCSVSAGAPAGIASMGLVRNVDVEDTAAGANVSIELCITEPGCLMGSIFELTVRRKVAALEGVARVEVGLDHGFVWDPSLMTPEYRARLEETRALAAERFASAATHDLGMPGLHPAG